MKRGIYWLLPILILANACRKEDQGANLINPSNANGLTEVLILPAGSQLINGLPPGPSGAGAPIISNPSPTVQGSNGSTAPLNFNYGSVGNNLAGCYVQVVGSNRYFNVPYTGSSGSSGSLSLPLGIPTNVDQGQFCVDFCVYDASGRVSNIVRTCVNIIRLGTGALQISLTWNNDSDQDLYVTTPSGCTIYFSNEFCDGGQLDRDDIDGFGPENIFWDKDAPNGTYIVEVEDFTGIPAGTDFFITINAPGISRQYPGRTQDGNAIRVVSFTKNGNNFIF